MASISATSSLPRKETALKRQPTSNSEELRKAQVRFGRFSRKRGHSPPTPGAAVTSAHGPFTPISRHLINRSARFLPVRRARRKRPAAPAGCGSRAARPALRQPPALAAHLGASSAARPTPRALPLPAATRPLTPSLPLRSPASAAKAAATASAYAASAAALPRARAGRGLAPARPPAAAAAPAPAPAGAAQGCGQGPGPRPPAAPPVAGGWQPFCGVSLTTPPPRRAAGGEERRRRRHPSPPPHPESPCGGRRGAGPCRPTRNPLWPRCCPSRQRGAPEPNRPAPPPALRTSRLKTSLGATL